MWSITENAGKQKSRAFDVFAPAFPRIKRGWQFPHWKESVTAPPVIWQWYFHHSPAKVELSHISPMKKCYTWGHLVSEIYFSYALFAQQMSDVALAVVLLECLRFFSERDKQNVGQELGAQRRLKPDHSDLEGVWEKKQWLASLIHGLYCLARSPYLNWSQVSTAWSSGSCWGALA